MANNNPISASVLMGTLYIDPKTCGYRYINSTGGTKKFISVVENGNTVMKDITGTDDVDLSEHENTVFITHVTNRGSSFNLQRYFHN